MMQPPVMQPMQAPQQPPVVPQQQQHNRGGRGGLPWPRGAPMIGGWVGQGDDIKHVGGNMVIYSPGKKSRSSSRSRLVICSFLANLDKFYLLLQLLRLK